MTNLNVPGGVGRVSWIAAGAFAVLGVVSQQANVIIGLNPTLWLLPAIVVCLLGVIAMVPRAMGPYLHSLEAQK